MLIKTKIAHDALKDDAGRTDAVIDTAIVVVNTSKINWFSTHKHKHTKFPIQILTHTHMHFLLKKKKKLLVFVFCWQKRNYLVLIKF